jgi:hypothetical protein
MPILSLADWETHAPPKSPGQWVDGRSAMEVARAWLESHDDMPPEVCAALRAHRDFGPVLTWDAEPEAKLRFDSFSGEPRNSDLAVIVSDAHGKYVLAVEAKADEPYGEIMAKAMMAAQKRMSANPRSKGVTRIQNLMAGLFPETVVGAIADDKLRYQLLTATAGALAEAQRRDMSRAVLLVHEFLTSRTTDSRHQRNSLDLQAFLNRLSGERIEHVKEGHLHGPYATAFAPDVRLYVGKITRSLRSLHLTIRCSGPRRIKS